MVKKERSDSFKLAGWENLTEEVVCFKLNLSGGSHLSKALEMGHFCRRYDREAIWVEDNTGSGNQKATWADGVRLEGLVQAELHLSLNCGTP